MSEGLRLKIRRDLGRWSRKLLLCIGLENVGSELVGERNWRQLYPLVSDWERDNKASPVSDFDPSGPTSFGHNAIDLFPDMGNLDPFPSTSPQTDDEDEENCEDQTEQERFANGNYDNLAHLLPYWYFINRAFGAPSSSNPGALGAVTEDLNVRRDRSPNPFSQTLDPQQLNTLLLLHSLKQQQQKHELQFQPKADSPGIDIPLVRVSKLQEFKDPHELVKSVLRAQRQRLPYNSYSHPATRSFPHDLEDQPLDLTYKSQRDFAEKTLGKSAQLIPPEVSSSNNGRDGRVMDRHSKLGIKSSPRTGRGYTIQEFESALNDIQSGKLGTRRAAVIYGIPRSTLRNKVYKLGKDRPRPYRLNEKIPSMGDLGRVSRTTTRPNVTKLEFDLAVPLPKGSAFTPVPKGSGASIQDLSVVGKDGSGDEVKCEEEISREKKALKEWLHSKLSRQRLTTSAEEADGIEYLGNSSTNLTPRYSPTPARDSETSSCNSDDGTQEYYDRNVLNSAPLSLETSPNYDTPRRRLKRRFYEDEDQFCPSSRTAQLSKTPPVDTVMPDWKTLNNDDDCSMDELDRDKVDKGHPDYYDPLDPECGNMSDGDGNGKKSRPKRGKYRNYDRDALVKAVKAVQNGEMSVHRAGSHFGVPHSTLEYKVKERHLLRRPTRKDRGSIQENGSPKLPGQNKSSPESSLSGSEVGVGSATPLHHLEYSPVATTTRESLARFLSTGSGGIELRRRSRDSPDSGSKALRQRLIGKEPDDRTSPSSFQLNDLLRRNFDNSSLLNMTKKL